MVNVKGQTFKPGDVVPLDGRGFADCRFEGCQFVYEGRAVTFMNCTFAECKLRLGPPLAMSIEALRWIGFDFVARKPTEIKMIN